MWQQFIDYWAVTLSQLRFGESFVSQLPVVQVVGERIWPTPPAGRHWHHHRCNHRSRHQILAGWRRNSRVDLITTNTGMVMYSAPTFWVSLIFIMIFATWLRWFPTGRMSRLRRDPPSWLRYVSMLLHHPLPAGLHVRHHLYGPVPPDRAQRLGRRIERGLRAHGARQGPVRRATCCGATSCPNAMLPTVTLVMMNIGFVMSGAILVETVFRGRGGPAVGTTP